MSSITQTVSVVGTISSQGSLTGTVSKPEIVGEGGGEVYEGEYTVTPDFSTQVLPTAHKRMMDDVTVHAIPYYEVTNPEGGTTVYIGMEVDIDG